MNHKIEDWILLTTLSRAVISGDGTTIDENEISALSLRANLQAFGKNADRRYVMGSVAQGIA
jgi:hypothetical protein